MPIAITPGEPAGIGPELVVQLAQHDHAAAWVVFADPDLLRARAEQLDLPLQLHEYTEGQTVPSQTAGSVWVAPIALNKPSLPGKPSIENAAYVLQTLEAAAQGCMAGHFSALTTGPVHKGHLQTAGFDFQGHTEFLAELTQTDHVVMLLIANELRVALVTTHIPLANVAEAIDQAKIIRTVEILHTALQQQFDICKPRIRVCGLNPHAGEQRPGSEETLIITPAISTLRARGWDIQGPLSADTVFTPQQLKHSDAVVAMYHDQGLPVLKYAGFGSAVNVTLGLPMIRTSVDHGTALDLAGSGQADPGSFLAALNLAYTLSQRE